MFLQDFGLRWWKPQERSCLLEVHATSGGAILMAWKDLEHLCGSSGTLTTLNTHARLGLTPSILNATTVNACVDTRRTNGKKWSFNGSCGLSKQHLILRCQRQNMAGWTVSWPQNISYILTTSSLNLYAASIAHSNLRAAIPHFFFRYIYLISALHESNTVRF